MTNNKKIVNLLFILVAIFVCSVIPCEAREFYTEEILGGIFIGVKMSSILSSTFGVEKKWCNELLLLWNKYITQVWHE